LHLVSCLNYCSLVPWFRPAATRIPTNAQFFGRNILPVFYLSLELLKTAFVFSFESMKISPTIFY